MDPHPDSPAPPHIQTYLHFSGNCEEAVHFYQTALDAEVEMMMRFKDAPEGHGCGDGDLPQGWEEKIMHTSFRVGSSSVMASDGRGEEESFSGFSLSITLPNKEAAEKAFDALADGGTVGFALASTFWSPLFGMVTDRFGITWMITLPHPSTPSAD